MQWTVSDEKPSARALIWEGFNGMDYTKITGSSSVDMLRFRLRYDGKPNEALEWFTLLHADMVVRFDRQRENHGHAIIRYPLSLRVGTYREMLKVPVNDTSIVIGLGKVGKETDYRTGFIEFNPAKTYPSEQLEYIYRRIESTPEVSLELVRWDFATDYPLKRDEVSLMRDKRHYTFVVSNGVTEYLGTRNKNGFVKLYDKQRELEAKGITCKEPKTRLEITIEEDGKRREPQEDGKYLPVDEWPKAVLVPKVANVDGALFSVFIEAWMGGVPLEKLLAHLSVNARTKYRKKIADECGLIPPAIAFDDCRQSAFAWERRYGGLAAS